MSSVSNTSPTNGSNKTTVKGEPLPKDFFTDHSKVPTRAVRRQKKSRQKRRLVQAPQAPFKAPIHSKCCIGGFRETGLALVIVLRCDWPLCDIWFKSYEHFKIKMFLGEASYRPRTGLVQVPFTGAWKKGGALAPFSHLGALRCQQLWTELNLF